MDECLLDLLAVMADDYQIQMFSVDTISFVYYAFVYCSALFDWFPLERPVSVSFVTVGTANGCKEPRTSNYWWCNGEKEKKRRIIT